MGERPQQEEIARTERTPIVQESRETIAREVGEDIPNESARTPKGGRIPPDNRPGHRPEKEQDKPTSPPKRR